MANLTIVARIKAKPSDADFVKSHLENLVATTRAEEGCVQYDLHQDNNDPSLFLFYENWESRETWQAHSNNQHIKEYKVATEGAIEEVTLFEMTRIA